MKSPRSLIHHTNHLTMKTTNMPRSLTEEEWIEIRSIREVRESWGIWDDASPEDMAEIIYAVHFSFTTSGPGYSCDLYILAGDVLSRPLVIVRHANQKMRIVRYPD